MGHSNPGAVGVRLEVGAPKTPAAPARLSGAVRAKVSKLVHKIPKGLCQPDPNLLGRGVSRRIIQRRLSVLPVLGPTGFTHPGSGRLLGEAQFKTLSTAKEIQPPQGRDTTEVWGSQPGQVWSPLPADTPRPAQRR